ncbi:MAG TPA: helix-turn-helix domain-containing protein [Spirochaetota bacterium]|nr:helix-turn-helix domain-containing protein [Spirochaetota bacterium]HPI89061.1 helix-turn-helix domain-containing protein [Spirochaetota bacterium]HPR48728.1 helix-turn-helix domain-containing protein [Spirochaetota bacterium]
MSANIETRQSKYTERYKDHQVLAEDILNDAQEADFFKQIRLRLKEVRKELKMTQREFGESSGIDRRYVAKVECGSQNPSFKFLRSISIKHKISLDWLLYGVGDKYVAAEEQSYGSELAVFKKLLDNASQDDIDVVVKMIKKILG